MGLSTVQWIIAVIVLLAADFAYGEIAAVGSANANPGTVTDLGNGIGIPSDPHGRGRANLAPTESAPPLSPVPHGEVNQRSVTPFGSPQPPNQLTPPPVLPFHPNRPLMPQSTPNSGGGRSGH